MLNALDWMELEGEWLGRRVPRVARREPGRGGTCDVSPRTSYFGCSGYLHEHERSAVATARWQACDRRVIAVAGVSQAGDCLHTRCRT